MALRLMQIFLPDGHEDDIKRLLEGHDVLGTWKDSAVSDRVVLQLLVPAEDTEAIMDGFEVEFSASSHFHILLSQIEAVIPRPKADDADSEVEGAGDDDKNGDSEAREAARVSREELYTEVVESLQANRVFVAMTVLSSVVAAIGLMRDDVAVIIGAMVIAPLLGPNMAMSFAAALGDLKLLRRAARTNIIGVTIAFGLSVLLGLTFSINPEVPAIQSRTYVVVTDVILALAAGAAGTFAFTRGLSGAVIGVMVAVALMPPLVTCGMLLGDGSFRLASGAFLLTAVNVICINLAGVTTFVAQGVRPRTWWEEERAKRAAMVAMVLWILLLTGLGVVLYVTQE